MKGIKQAVRSLDRERPSRAGSGLEGKQPNTAPVSADVDTRYGRMRTKWVEPRE